MNASGDLNFDSNGILPVKEEIEIGETQLQEQIFDGCDVKPKVEDCWKIVINEKSPEVTRTVEPKQNETKNSVRKTRSAAIREKTAARSSGAVVETPSKYECKLCEKSFNSRPGLRSHLYLHRGERPFKCDTCSMSFTSKQSLSSHKVIHSDQRKYVCTFCNKLCKRDSDRRTHEKTHSNERTNHQCKKCKLYFRLEEQYRSHLDEKKCKGYAKKKPFKCSKCKTKSFSSIELLDQHKAKVHPPSQKDHKCSVCSKAYRSKYKLEFHMNSHTGNLPFACTICPKKFGNPEYLRKHKLAHDSTRYECSLCNEKFTDYSNRLRHEKKHSNYQAQQCNACEKYFKNENQLRSHSEYNKCKGNL